jgi:hypothetical protein
MHRTKFDRKNSIDIHGTHVPVEEPSTASKADIPSPSRRTVKSVTDLEYEVCYSLNYLVWCWPSDALRSLDPEGAGK